MKKKLFSPALVILIGLFAVVCLFSLNNNVYAQSQGMEVNKNLKNAIEENQKLINKTKSLEDEIRRLQNENALKDKKVEQIKGDRDSLIEDIKEVKKANREYLKNIQELGSVGGNAAAQATNAPSTYVDPSTKEMVLAAATTQEVENMENKTLDLLSKIDAFAEEDETLKTDAAKAHYNMGNVYFQKGEYEIAAREFYQASILMPNDPDVHYNLAFVSGDYLKDFDTALKHYQMYLYLNPNAADQNVVKEKIVEAKLNLRSITNSVLDKKDKK